MEPSLASYLALSGILFTIGCVDVIFKRHATRADAEAIAGFAVALFELHSKWDPRRFSQIATTEGAARFYGDRSEAGSVLVAEVEGRTAGFVYFEYEETLYAELAKRTIW